MELPIPIEEPPKLSVVPLKGSVELPRAAAESPKFPVKEVPEELPNLPVESLKPVVESFKAPTV